MVDIKGPNTEFIAAQLPVDISDEMESFSL